MSIKYTKNSQHMCTYTIVLKSNTSNIQNFFSSHSIIYLQLENKTNTLSLKTGLFNFIYLLTVASRHNEDLVITNNIWKAGRITVIIKICGNKPCCNEPCYNEIPAIENRFWQSQCTIYPALMNMVFTRKSVDCIAWCISHCLPWFSLVTPL